MSIKKEVLRNTPSRTTTSPKLNEWERDFIKLSDTTKPMKPGVNRSHNVIPTGVLLLLFLSRVQYKLVTCPLLEFRCKHPKPYFERTTGSVLSTICLTNILTLKEWTLYLHWHGWRSPTTFVIYSDVDLCCRISMSNLLYIIPIIVYHSGYTFNLDKKQTCNSFKIKKRYNSHISSIRIFRKYIKYLSKLTYI